MHVNFIGFRLNDIIRYLDINRIDCCWLLSWEEISPGPWPYQHLSIEDIYDAYLKYPSRIIPFYAPDPHKDGAANELEYWYQKGIRGCGELKSTLNWGSSNIQKLLTTVQKLGMPIAFHMEESEARINLRSSTIFDRILYRGLRAKRKIYQVPKKVLYTLVNRYSPLRNRFEFYTFPGYMLDFASLEVILADCPHVNFVAHGPMFWKYISADVATRNEMYPRGPVVGEGIIWRLLRDYPNLYADVSGTSGYDGLTKDPEFAKNILSKYDNKILFGTDNYSLGLRDFLDSLRLPKSTYKLIYGENAAKLIK
jgi:predicted TIM-barrel fold metal-dependent hydrolase